MISRMKHPRVQGDAGLATAISWFARQGIPVFIPLTDSQKYDLVVEMNSSLKKVFVRTTTQTSPYGIYECDLRSTGHNNKKLTTLPFDKSSCDFLFIVCGDGSQFLIPSEIVACKSTISFGKKYAQYLVER